MLRIWENQITTGATMLKIDGQVRGAWVREVQATCDAVLARGARLTLDMSDMNFADRAAVLLFHNLLCRNVELINCSPFLLEQLKSVQLECPQEEPAGVGKKSA